MFVLKLLKYLLAIGIVLGGYTYLKNEGAFKKEKSFASSEPTALSSSAVQNEREEGELVWPDLEEPKSVSPADEGVKAQKVLEYLLQDKLQDKAAHCVIKKAKKTTFVGCRSGNIVKDSYWELSSKGGHLQLLTRNGTALYLAKKYRYKELVADAAPINAKIEKALVAFFSEPR